MQLFSVDRTTILSEVAFLNFHTNFPSNGLKT
jgi:hypothetical protein